MTQPLEEKTLSSQEIFKGRVIRVQVDSIQLPNGTTGTREVVRHPGAVAIVPITADGKIIMVEQYRYAAKRVMLEIPAGTLKENEDPDVCAERELQEEIGYKPNKLEKLGGIYLAPGYSSEYIHLYIATDLVASRLDMDEDEFINTSELPLTEVLAKIADGTICDAKTISALLFIRERLNR